MSNIRILSRAKSSRFNIVPGGDIVGRHNHSSRHDHRRRQGRNHHSDRSRRNSKNDRLKILSDQTGLGWSGV